MTQYIIVFKEKTTESEIQRYKDDIEQSGGSVTKANFGGLLHGFAADVPSHYVSALKDFSPDSPIEYIEADSEVTTQ